MDLSEKHILTLLQKGEEKGMRQLFDRYYRPLCLFALKYIDTVEEAEDLVQDTLIRFWNNKSYKLVNAGLKSYLFTAVRNNALNHLRKNSKYRFEEIDNQVIDLVDDELNEEDLEVLKDKLFKEIEALPEKGREIFKAIVLQNLKYKEVAELFGISVNTVKTHYSRTLNKLRNSLDILILVLLA